MRSTLLAKRLVQTLKSSLRRMPPGTHRCLTQCFGAGWVGMADQGDVFCRRCEFHGDAVLGNHLADTWAHQVYAEDFVGALVGQDFGEAFGFMVDLGAAVGT